MEKSASHRCKMVRRMTNSSSFAFAFKNLFSENSSWELFNIGNSCITIRGDFQFICYLHFKYKINFNLKRCQWIFLFLFFFTYFLLIQVHYLMEEWPLKIYSTAEHKHCGIFLFQFSACISFISVFLLVKEVLYLAQQLGNKSLERAGNI